MRLKYIDPSGLGDLVFDDEKNEAKLWIKVTRFNGYTHLHKTKSAKTMGEAKAMLQSFIETQQNDERKFVQSKIISIKTKQDPTKGIF